MVSPNLVPATIAARSAHWSSEEWWRRELRRAITTGDPKLCNLRITLAHYELSLALHDLIGISSGPNFHTWAVWGSKKAGTTIRREDISHITPISAVAGTLAGLALSHIAPPSRGGRRPLDRQIIAALAGGIGCLGLTNALLRRASLNVLAGNITVLDDIGHATVHFVGCFHDQPRPDTDRLNAFLATLRPGPAEQGGQDLLREAFTHYYLARHEPNPDAQAEHMLLANLKAILHEHQRLQPYIAAAMPATMRRVITTKLLRFEAGAQTLSVHRDVLAWQGEDCPAFLQQIENADLLRFLVGPGGWDRTPDSLQGSHAGDWSDIHDRMNYICDLFRYRYFDPGLFSAPYDEAQCAAILAGRVPLGPL